MTTPRRCIVCIALVLAIIVTAFSRRDEYGGRTLLWSDSACATVRHYVSHPDSTLPMQTASSMADACMQQQHATIDAGVLLLELGIIGAAATVAYLLLPPSRPTLRGELRERSRHAR